MIYPETFSADRATTSANSGQRIAPCPYSPRFFVDTAEAWKSLTVYWFYRLMMAGILVSLHLNEALPGSLSGLRPELFTPVALTYLGAIIAAGVPLLLRRPGYAVQAQLQVFSDIALLPVVIHASGGLSSGTGVLMGMAVAAGGILVGGRCALLFAALASLAVLMEQVYSDLTGALDPMQYTYGGLLGASFFGIAVAALELARRSEKTLAIAENQGRTIINLKQINEFIIRNLDAGILVAEADGTVRLYNDSATRLLPEVRAGSLAAASPGLAERFAGWLRDPVSQIIVLGQEVGRDLHVRFTSLGDTRPPLYMINLEDGAAHNRRVQLSKLASLGRLTASIAHEIRNPLGAISHAGQLLAESPALAGQDQRLVQIILEHSVRLNNVVENVLQISRRAEAQREIFRLETTLARFLPEIAANLSVDPATFALESRAGDPEVAFDLSHLRQILDNLCSNALKYGRPELGPITARIVRRQGDACLELVDHAPPIDPETGASLFEPFFTTGASGTGLGLYIARELAELNQARLEYSSAGDVHCFRLWFRDARQVQEP